MQRSFGLQISDLETSQSVFEQELTMEEAKKIVGGSGDAVSKKPKDPKDPDPCEGCIVVAADNNIFAST